MGLIRTKGQSSSMPHWWTWTQRWMVTHLCCFDSHPPNKAFLCHWRWKERNSEDILISTPVVRLGVEFKPVTSLVAWHVKIHLSAEHYYLKLFQRCENKSAFCNNVTVSEGFKFDWLFLGYSQSVCYLNKSHDLFLLRRVGHRCDQPEVVWILALVAWWP